MPRSDVIQMIGRAGRPGFDKSGCAVIMTSNEDRNFYHNVTVNAEVIESSLHKHFAEGQLSIALILKSNLKYIEAMCTEITQGVVRNMSEALVWAKSTFLYVRCIFHVSYN
jgi:ATP-dependent DNA helicase HFM1/MER3